jgi:hypothetical protein
MKTIARLNFGNSEVYDAPDHILIGRVYSTPRFVWVNEVREYWRPGVEDPLLLSFVGGPAGELRLGLPTGDYTLRLTCFDPAESHGPFGLSAASIDARSPMGMGVGPTLIKDLVVPQGQLVRPEVSYRHSSGALALRFSAAEGQTFALNGLDILGPDGVEAQSIFADAPSDIVPSVEEVLVNGRDDPKAALHAVCEWLLRHRKSDGFLGDPEGTRRWWYTSAYPIRTLLAGFDIFGETRYLAAVQDIVDRFVSEQMPNGAFAQAYIGRPTAGMSDAELEEIRAHYWMNMADLGSSAAALAACCRYVTGDRQKRYLAAVRKFCDRWAKQFQMPNGGFLNGWLAGHYAKWIYSIATATEGQTFALTGAVSGDSSYMEVAERAAEFLLREWNDDGRPHTYPFDDYFPGHPFYERTKDTGETFYFLEGLLGTAYVTPNAALKRRIWETMHKYILGSQGMLATWGSKPWWPIQDTWHNSKSAATPLALGFFLQFGREYGATDEEMARVERAYHLARKFLCTPAYARQIGVMSDDPDLPWGGHSLQSWTGCAVAATGFCGIALADMVKPSLTFLAG